MKRALLFIVGGLIILVGLWLLPKGDGPSEDVDQPTQQAEEPRQKPSPRRTQNQGTKTAVQHKDKRVETYTVAGVVLDHHRLPRVEQSLWLLQYTYSERSPGFSWSNRDYLKTEILDRQRVTTDGDGRFSVEIPRNHGVDLVVDEQGLSRVHLAQIHELDQDKRTRLEVVVTGAATIAGEVNRQRWPEVIGVELAGIKGLNFRDSIRFKDRGGLFGFDDLPPGSYYVRLRFPKNVDLSGLGTHWLQEVRLVPNERAHVDFGFDLMLNLGGRVLLEGVSPGESTLYLMPQGARNWASCHWTTCDEEGFFNFYNLPPGTYELVFPQIEGDQQQVWGLIRLHPSRQTVVLDDQDLSKVFHFALQGGLSGRLGGEPDLLGFRLEGPEATPLGGLETPTEGDGYFQFPALPPGKYRLYAIHDSDPVEALPFNLPRGIYLSEVTMPESGADVDLGDLQLEKRAALRTVVHLEQMAMPQHLVLYLWPGDEKNPSMSNAITRRLLQPEREQLVEGLPAGHVRLGLFSNPAAHVLIKPYLIQLEPDREGKAHLFISPPTELRVNLAPGPFWRSMVLSDENGRMRRSFRQVGNFSLVDLGTGGAILEMVDRTARATNLAPGNYILSAFAEDGGRSIRQFYINAGQTVALSIQFDQP